MKKPGVKLPISSVLQLQDFKDRDVCMFCRQARKRRSWMLLQFITATTITVSRVLPHPVLSTLLSHGICCVDTVSEIPPHSAFLLQRNLRLDLAMSPVYCFLLLTKAINHREGKQSWAIGWLTGLSAACVNECHPKGDWSQQAPLCWGCEDG